MIGESFITRARNVADEVRRANAGVLDIEPSIAHLERKSVTVAATGAFSTGKSLTLSRLFSRDVFPSSKQRETGAPVTVYAGPTDEMYVELADGRVIGAPCSRETVQFYTSLRDEAGEPRPQGLETRRLNIMLRDYPLDNSVHVVDLPGRFDSAKTDERIAAEEHAADAVIWFSRGSAFLPASEQAVLAELVAAKGPDAVTIVMNVLIPKRSTWEEFVRTEFPRQRARFERLPISGSDPGGAPALIPICAGRMLEQDDPDGFGRRDLLREVGSLVTESGAVQRSRARRARTALQTVQQQVAQRGEARTVWERRTANYAAYAEYVGAEKRLFAAEAKRLLSVDAKAKDGSTGLTRAVLAFRTAITSYAATGEAIDADKTGDIYNAKIAQLAAVQHAAFLTEVTAALKACAAANDLRSPIDQMFADANLLALPQHQMTYFRPERGVNAGIASVATAGAVVAAATIVPFLIPLALLVAPTVYNGLHGVDKEHMQTAWSQQFIAAGKEVEAFWIDRCQTLCRRIVDEAESTIAPPPEPGAAPNNIESVQWSSWSAEIGALLEHAEIAATA